MSTTSAARRPRGAPGRTLGLRIGRSVVPVGMVIAILAAAVGGIALAASVRDARAAEIPNAITSISVREETTTISSNLRVDLTWAVPDSAGSGDTFRVTLPDELDSVLNGFPLRAPDGQVVANATVSGKVVTFTLTDYADRYQNVRGTAYFATRVDRSVVTEPGTVDLVFRLSNGVTFDDSVTLTPGSPSSTIDRTKPRKYGYWTDQADEGTTQPVGAQQWVIETPRGPLGAMTLTDAIQGGATIDCDSVRVRSTDEFDEREAGVGFSDLPSSAYDVTCTPTGLTITADPVPVVLADYDIDKPTGGPIAEISDEGSFEFLVVLTQG